MAHCSTNFCRVMNGRRHTGAEMLHAGTARPVWEDDLPATSFSEPLHHATPADLIMLGMQQLVQMATREPESAPVSQSPPAPGADFIPPEGLLDQLAELEIDHAHTGQEDTAAIQLGTRGAIEHFEDASEPWPKTLRQSELWQRNLHWTSAVAARLRQSGRADLSEPLEHCHTERVSCVCSSCNRTTAFYNRCDLFYCPTCTPRLTRQRAEGVAWWAVEVSQPKHVILTVRNVPHITKGHVQEFKRWLSRLRKRKFARGWRGGFYGLQITNRGKGWHLHAHLLIDARWIDCGQLSAEWRSVTSGTGENVVVKDVRDSRYLHEVCRYISNPSQVARWSGQQLAEYVDALQGLRTFAVFGSLWGKRTEFKEWLDSVRYKVRTCECGCTNFRYLSDSELSEYELTHGPSVPRPPPPPAVAHPEFRW